MNEDLQKQLAELLAKLMTVASDSAQWAASQIPPLVQEKIVLGRVEATFAIVLSVAFIAVYGRRLRGLMARAEKDENFAIAQIMGGVALSVLSLFVFFENIHDLFLVWLAPRLYIVEWLRGMVKS